MSTLGDDAGAWLATGDGLLPVVGALFGCLLVIVAIVAAALAIWNGIGRS